MGNFTTVRRALAFAVAALLGGLAATALSVPDLGDAATATTYSLTVSGTDAVTLNPRVVPLSNGGGAVEASGGGASVGTGAPFFEVHLDLPVGAKVTSVAISYQTLIVVDPGSFTFGSYSPSGGPTNQIFTITPASSDGVVKTSGRRGDPLTTVAAGRRYVLDWGYGAPGRPAAFNGATVKYTCVAPCVP
jgi:hypothetical protein